ncbi:MAG: hypothetical protein AB8G23_14080 [Myxococcota bacterium]
MWTKTECAGHPRDMGLAQGEALRASIVQELARHGLATERSRMPSLTALAVGSIRGQGAGREMFRHFAHLAERLEGLAKRASVPLDSLLELHLRIREGGEAGGLLSRRASLRAKAVPGGEGPEGSKSALLERSLPAALRGEAGWIVRQSEPAVGFRSVEITLPWLVSSVAGVNEGGLAVMAGPMLWGTPGFAGASPSHLLVQECLQRFEDLEGALGWCQKRPVEGDQSFVLADASGAVATVISKGRRRRVQPGEGELFIESGEGAADGDASEAEASSTSSSSSTEAEEVTDRVLLDPSARRLQLDAAGSTLELTL